MFPTIQFTTPSIIFGMDTISQIGQQAKKLGAGRALLVTGPNVKEAGILDKALSYFKFQGRIDHGRSQCPRSGYP